MIQMADFQLETGFQVTDTVVVLDQNGAAISGLALDAATGAVAVSDATVLTATLSADQATVDVKTVGPLGTGEVVTITGSVGGVALTGTQTIDVIAVPQTPTSLGLVPGTPVANA
jgi:hypothetical protein